MKSILILTLLFCSFSVKGQLIKTLDSLTKQNQKCLDSGVNMLGCSRTHYLQVDSMLNVVYKKLRRSLNENQKLELKNEQLAWLSKRDKYFTEQDKIFQSKFNSGEWGNDMGMITYDNKSEFVKKRVIELIKRVEK